MWPKIWIQTNPGNQTLLQKWQGSVAEPWAYSVSHSQFLLRLHRNSQESLFVWCKGCSQVSFQEHWTSANLSVSGESDQELKVIDDPHLSIICSAAYVAETDEYNITFPMPNGL